MSSCFHGWRDEQQNKICQHENIIFFLLNITFVPHLKPDLLRNLLFYFSFTLETQKVLC